MHSYCWLVTALHITYYTTQHWAALHDVVPTLDHAVTQSGRWHHAAHTRHGAWGWYHDMAAPLPAAGGKVRYWWMVVLLADGPQGRHQHLAAPWVHFITILSYNKELFSSSEISQDKWQFTASAIELLTMNCNYGSIIGYFKFFIYFTHGGIIVLSLSPFRAGFPSTRHHICTREEDPDCSQHFMTSLHCWLFGPKYLVFFAKQ